MIERVRIQNFRSIRDLEVGLSPFSVLVGPNGAGKTNFVQALSLLGQMIDVGSTDPVRNAGWGELIRRGAGPARTMTLGATLHRRMTTTRLGSAPGASVHRVEISVKLRGDRDHVDVLEERLAVWDDAGQLLVRVVDLAGHPSVEVRAPDRVAALPGVPPGFDPLQFPPRRKEGDEGRFLRIFQPFSPYRPLVRSPLLVFRFRFDASGLRTDTTPDGSGLDLTGRNLAAEVDRMRGRGDRPADAFEPVLAGLRLVYDRIDDVRAVLLPGARLSLQFHERGIRAPLDPSAVSDGVLHALAFLVAIFTDGQGVLAIEEPENAIHPWAARSLIGLAQEHQRRQIVLTTHSETVVSAISDPRSLFLVEHGDRGTTIERAADRSRSLDVILRETGQKLGDVWIDGSLGGVPDGPS